MSWTPPHPHPPAPVQPPQHQFSSLSLLDIHVFIGSLHVYITYTYVSQLQRLEESLASTKILPPSIHNNPPTKTTFHPPLVERIPICPGAKFQPCFARAERRASWCLPREGSPPPSPHRAKKCYKLLREPTLKAFF